MAWHGQSARSDHSELACFDRLTRREWEERRPAAWPFLKAPSSEAILRCDAIR